MARRRRTLNYRELRAEDEEVQEEEELEEEEDEEEEEEDEEEEEEDGIEGEEDDDEPRPKKKKKKVKEPKVKAKRTRASKSVRMKVVWGVFNNSNQRIATYEYKQKKEAEEHAAKMTAAKPNNTHFIQPVKEPIETKAE